MPSKLPLIVIVGPNASGKSELAVKLAKKFSGEIISADSRQVYRGLNIGTGKVEGKWVASRLIPLASGLARRINKNIVRAKSRTYLYKGIPHHCIDFISPQRTFTAAEYKKCAQAAIYNITGRKRLPILAGGTGFWIDAVAYDINFPAVPPNPKLRKRLEKKDPTELLKILRKLDPQRAKTVERKNPRRLVRAIEIAKILGRVPKIKKGAPYRILWIGWRPSGNILKKKIHARLLKRLKAGLIAEARRLRAKGLSWKRFYELGLEYKFLADYLRRKITKKEMVSGLEATINDYAGRQIRWFKRNRDIRWVHTAQEAEKLVQKFLA